MKNWRWDSWVPWVFLSGRLSTWNWIKKKKTAFIKWVTVNNLLDQCLVNHSLYQRLLFHSLHQKLIVRVSLVIVDIFSCECECWVFKTRYRHAFVHPAVTTGTWSKMLQEVLLILSDIWNHLRCITEQCTHRRNTWNRWMGIHVNVKGWKR